MRGMSTFEARLRAVVDHRNAARARGVQGERVERLLAVAAGAHQFQAQVAVEGALPVGQLAAVAFGRASVFDGLGRLVGQASLLGVLLAALEAVRRFLVQGLGGGRGRHAGHAVGPLGTRAALSAYPLS